MKKLDKKSLITLFLILYDSITIVISGALALLIRHDFLFFSINVFYIEAYKNFILFYVLFSLVLYSVFKLNKFIWTLVSYNELFRIVQAVVLSSAFEVIGTLVFAIRMPISFYIMSFIFQLIFAVVVRYAYRFYLLLCKKDETKKLKNILLIGAGSAGQIILRDININSNNEKVVCVIDDNKSKWHKLLENVEIIGGREHILSSVEKYNIKKILIAIPSAPSKEIKEIIEICSKTGCKVLIIPSLYKFSKQNLTIDSLRNIEIEDLLGREPVEIDMEGVFNFIKGKTIVVTGGGGSIGSEICRQVASHSPKQLIIFDIYENNAYEIQLELRKEYPQLNLVTLIGSVRDIEKVLVMFSDYKPDIVYHAAAHKHVPLMEDSPCEAIKNNVLGTYNVAFAALKNNVERFVLISTDKAVNPTNIMGASKRLCEMVTQSFSHLSRANELDVLEEIYNKKYKLPKETNTIFSAVRFGNVLGSNGSVITIFRKQIADGGPVTVTDPNVVRFFMSIQEAVRLVMQAGLYADGGEIFVLDMGEPVKIDTLAKKLISLAGYTPNKDIKIVYTGLRPGEKMYEERLMTEEGLKKTANDYISIGKPIKFNTIGFILNLKKLAKASYNNDKNIEDLVKHMVPTYEKTR